MVATVASVVAVAAWCFAAASERQWMCSAKHSEARPGEASPPFYLVEAAALSVACLDCSAYSACVPFAEIETAACGCSLVAVASLVYFLAWSYLRQLAPGKGPWLQACRLASASAVGQQAGSWALSFLPALHSLWVLASAASQARFAFGRNFEIVGMVQIADSVADIEVVAETGNSYT